MNQQLVNADRSKSSHSNEIERLDSSHNILRRPDIPNLIASSFIFASWRIRAYFLVAIIPTVVVSIYMLLMASDQYEAEFKFNIRSAASPSLSARIGGNNGTGVALPGGGLDANVIWDSHGVVQYIKSSTVIDELQRRIDFRKLYDSPHIDWISRLNSKRPIEDVVAYWDRMVDPYFDLATGIVTVKVRAFNSADAELVAKSVLQLSEELVNSLSVRSRRDAVSFAEETLASAETKLHEAQSAVTTFRDQRQVLDPPKQAEQSGILLGKLKEELAGLRTQYDSMRAYLAPNAIALKVLQTRIDATEEELRQQQQKLTQTQSQPNSNVMSSVLAQYESLQLERTFREKAYEISLDALRNARMEAERQQLYLNAIVQPRIPEEPTYPRRWRAIALTFAGGTFFWMVGLLLFYSIRDHIA